MSAGAAKLLAARIRVLVVDDDPTYRRIVSTILGSMPEVELVGTAATLALARRCIEQGNVDAVTLDCVLRDESGLDLLEWIRATHPKIVVILLTAGQNKAACRAVDALLLGASGIVIKPSGRQAEQELKTALQSALAAAAPQPLSSLPPLRSLPPGTPQGSRVHAQHRELIAVGASTGGPPVLLRFLRELPASFDVPIVITQHMHASHLGYFIDLLAAQSGRQVRPARHGELVEPGQTYVAGRAAHLLVERVADQIVLLEDDGPEEHNCKPSVDPMFRSVARTCGEWSVGVVMTGMGSDGALGAAAMRAIGAPVVAQDQATSVVWGMPGATVALGAANKVVAGDALAQCVVQWTTGWKPSRRTNTR